MKPKPFYISLYISSFRLSNRIIDYRAFENVMLDQIAKALGLSYTSLQGKCYSMDGSLVPIIGQIKDSQVALATFPKKEVEINYTGY